MKELQKCSQIRSSISETVLGMECANQQKRCFESYLKRFDVERQSFSIQENITCLSVLKDKTGLHINLVLGISWNHVKNKRIL